MPHDRRGACWRGSGRRGGGGDGRGGGGDGSNRAAPPSLNSGSVTPEVSLDRPTFSSAIVASAAAVAARSLRLPLFKWGF